MTRLTLMTAALVVIGGSSSVFACPVCFGAEETSMIDGAKLGVLVMLGILFAVQGGFVGFFLYLASARSASRTLSSRPNGRSSKGRREHDD